MTDFVLTGNYFSGITSDALGNFHCFISESNNPPPYNINISTLSIITSYSTDFTAHPLGLLARYWKVLLNDYVVLDYTVGTFYRDTRLIGSYAYDASHLVPPIAGRQTFKFDFVFSIARTPGRFVLGEYTVEYFQGINAAETLEPIIIAVSVGDGPVGVPPLRINQRQDGLGPQGHARQNQIGASNSGSENTGHRLKGSNTYV